jgi:hypothetical protein
MDNQSTTEGYVIIISMYAVRAIHVEPYLKPTL